MKIILTGPPGSGKGTQATRLAKKLGVGLVATGDLFRDHQKRGTALGQLAQSYMKQGLYVPDDVTINMIKTWITSSEQEEGFILDGFPRTLIQARALDDELETRGGIDRVLFINVSEAELIRRLTGRSICRDCQVPYHTHSSPPSEPGRCNECGGSLYQRVDDDREVVGKRISVYFKETEPVVEHYRNEGKLREIDGEHTIGKVGEHLLAAVY